MEWERLPSDTEVKVRGRITDNETMSEQLRYTVAEYEATYKIDQLGFSQQEMQKIAEKSVHA